MSQHSPQQKMPHLRLSHLELYVQNKPLMEAFFTQSLGFVVTDRGQGEQGMVFLSLHLDEHHQLVLNPRQMHKPNSPVDHISFKVASLSELRCFYQRLVSSYESQVQTVSHGNSWSIYFRDPEGNRFEIFTDSPWYVPQPCKFQVDFELDDEALLAFTLEKVQDVPGFTPVVLWKQNHEKNI